MLTAPPQAAPPRNASSGKPPGGQRLPESASLLLDVIRFTLSLLVVLGHITLPWFSTAWPSLIDWANAAVPGFFVLSGFMIRYVTLDRERDPRRYFISRASRMYSVLLPAIVLTLGCRLFLFWRFPRYAAALCPPESPADVLAHVGAHLAFLTQFWGHAVLLSPNLPLWSLGYEVPYYILFGLLVLCRGPWRWIAAALYALALGPQVLFLLPLWWSGCWLYDLWQWTRAARKREVWTAIIALLSLVVLFTPFHQTTVWLWIEHLPNPLLLLGQRVVRATMLAYAAGIASWLTMLLGLCASQWTQLSGQAPWVRPVRRLAEGTFTLYLFHYPLLCLAIALRRRVLTSASATLGTMLIIVAVCVAASAPIDALKNSMRKSLTRRFATS